MEDPASRLCLSCGLCCTGALFDRAKAAPEERPALEILGLDWVEEKGATGFRQPCPAFREGACGVYEQRPRVCRTFRCRLLRNLDKGAVTMAEALATVATAREMLRRGAAAGRDLTTVAARERVCKAGPRGSEGDEASTAPRLYLEAVAIGMYLQRHFRRPPKTPDVALKDGAARS